MAKKLSITERNIKSAISKIILSSPFFSVLLLNQEIVYSQAIPTFATTGKQIIINLDYAETLSVDEIKGVLIHEIMHSVFFHLTRLNGKHKGYWNMAGDYAINPIIKKEGFVLPESHLDEQRFHSMSADEIYRILIEEQPEIPKELMDIKSEHMTEAEAKHAEQQTKIDVAKASNIAGKDIPDSIRKLVQEVIETKIDWKAKLRDFVQESLGTDETTWKRPNRNYLHDKLYIPSLSGRSMPSIAVMFDTSGSIYAQKDLFAEFTSELTKIIEDMVPETVDLFYVDTRIQKHETYEEGEIPKYELEGGGGTDFTSAWPIMEECQPACIIAFTDLWASLPEHSDVPTMWMTYENKEPYAPFGEITIID